MKARLLVLKHENAVDYTGARHLRFTVVDLDKSKNYPLNFVCLLPIRVNSKDRESSKFVGIFGDRSLEVAKELLTDALKAEDDENVRTEIERRLALLKP